VERHGGVATLTLNRGNRFNPLSSGMIAALQSELDAIAQDTDVRVVVIAASGKCFCADIAHSPSHRLPEVPWM
jgi:enoyl-CoA hydratase/carnithine racemase